MEMFCVGKSSIHLLVMDRTILKAPRDSNTPDTLREGLRTQKDLTVDQIRKWFCLIYIIFP